MIYAAAGRLRIDPRPFTWRALDEMDRAARKDDWQHTGDICYVVAQTQSKSTVDRHQFDRFYQSEKELAGPVRRVKPSELKTFG